MSRLILALETSAYDRLAVIKDLPPDVVSPQSTARFNREVDVAAHLQHPNILPILGAGVRGALLYYIMPFVEGESLRRRLERGVMSPSLDTTLSAGTGVSLGTLGYMPPEQLLATGPVDARADIYSIGMVAYELLSGAHLFTGTSPTTLAARHLYEIPRALSEVDPSIPLALSDAVARTLAKNPNDRQHSTADLRDALDSALALL